MAVNGFSIGFRYPRSTGTARILNELSRILPGTDLRGSSVNVYPQESDPISGEETELLSIEDLPLRNGKKVWRMLRSRYSFLALLKEYEPVVMGGWIERCGEALQIGTFNENGRLIASDAANAIDFTGEEPHDLKDRIDGVVFAFPSEKHSARERCCRTAEALQRTGRGKLFRLIPLCDHDTAVRTFTSDLHGRFCLFGEERIPAGLLPDKTIILDIDRIGNEHVFRACIRHASEQGCRSVCGVTRDPRHSPFGDIGGIDRVLSMNDSGWDTLNDLLCEKTHALRKTIKRWYCSSAESDEILFHALWKTAERSVPLPEAVPLSIES